MDPSLSVSLPGLELSNPTILASGILGDDPNLLTRVAEAGIGGLTTKSFTVESREGYKPPIIAYVKAGMVNAVGLSNPGYRYLRNLLSRVKGLGIPVIVNIAGTNIDEYLLIAEEATEAGANALELNLSCPHVKGYGLEILNDREYSYKIVKDISSITDLPVYPKIGLIDDYIGLVSRLLDGGASGITAINTVRAIAIDIYARRPILSNIYGGLSGPAIHPIALRVVYDIYKEFNIPIIGVGGVVDWDDIVSFMLAGASAVGIGTIISVRGLRVIGELIKGLRMYLRDEGFRDVNEIIGLAVK